MLGTTPHNVTRTNLTVLTQPDLTMIIQILLSATDQTQEYMHKYARIIGKISMDEKTTIRGVCICMCVYVFGTWMCVPLCLSWKFASPELSIFNKLGHSIHRLLLFGRSTHSQPMKTRKASELSRPSSITTRAANDLVLSLSFALYSKLASLHLFTVFSDVL